MTATTAVDTARATDDADDDVSNDARTRARDRAMDETRAVRVVVVDARAVGVARMRTARDAFESDVSERRGTHQNIATHISLSLPTRLV